MVDFVASDDRILLYYLRYLFHYNLNMARNGIKSFLLRSLQLSRHPRKNGSSLSSSALFIYLKLSNKLTKETLPEMRSTSMKNPTNICYDVSSDVCAVCPEICIGTFDSNVDPLRCSNIMAPTSHEGLGRWLGCPQIITGVWGKWRSATRK